MMKVCDLRNVDLRTWDGIRVVFWKDSAPLDGLPVQVAWLTGVELPYNRFPILQRAPASCQTTSKAFNGFVRLFCLTDWCFLVLAFSKRVASTYERLGILFGETGRHFPSLKSLTKLEIVRCVDFNRTILI